MCKSQQQFLRQANEENDKTRENAQMKTKPNEVKLLWTECFSVRPDAKEENDIRLCFTVVLNEGREIS